MIISYLGHSCFKIETHPSSAKKGDKLTLVIDPFDEKTGKLPSVKADLVLSTHNHNDHNYLKGVKGFTEKPFVIDSAGEYSFKGISVFGLRTFHDNQDGKEKGFNTVYVIESENIRICHLGDLGHILNKDQLDELGNIDVLMIPTGDKYTINLKDAVSLVKLIEPSLVVPMHYKMEGINIDDIAEAEEFYKAFGQRPQEKTNKLKLKSGNFNEDEMKVIEFTR